MIRDIQNLVPVVTLKEEDGTMILNILAQSRLSVWITGTRMHLLTIMRELGGLWNWPTVLKLSGHAPNINTCPQNCAIDVFVSNITHSTKMLSVLALDQPGTRDTKLKKTKVLTKATEHSI